MKTYFIEYIVYFIDGNNKKLAIKVKNCDGDLHAKVKLERYLQKKYIDFERLEVIKCNRDVMSIFGDIFGSNPFSF